MPKTSSIRLSVSVELRLVADTDRHTDRQTQGHSYSTRASIASRRLNVVYARAVRVRFLSYVFTTLYNYATITEVLNGNIRWQLDGNIVVSEFHSGLA